jgi:hypothetical protein
MTRSLPSVEPLGGGQILLRGRAVVDAYRLAQSAAEQVCRRDGLVLPVRVTELLAVLRVEAEAVLASVAADGQTATPQPVPAAELGVGDPVGVEEVAQMAGISVRSARRMAHELGGRKLGRAWVFDRAEVVAIIAERRVVA